MPPPSSRTDHELMAGVRRGDMAALDALFTRHHQRLYSFLARWTGDAFAAEDLVQELFLKLLRVQGGHIPGEVLPWLFLVARNMAIDRYRKEYTSSIEVDAVVPDDRPLALERLTADERMQQLDDALAALPRTHREVLLLRGVEGLGTRDIGVVLNCSEGAARVRLHRATAALRQIWHARHGDD